MAEKKYSDKDMAEIIISTLRKCIDKSYVSLLMLADKDREVPFIEVTFDNGQVALLKVLREC